MKIQGVVYCDCYEKEKIVIDSQFNQLIQLDYDGSLVMLTENEDQELLFDEWRKDACEHTNGILISHQLISSEDELISLQEVFSLITEEEDFDCPVIYESLLYNESNDDNDFITVENLLPLINEMKNIQPFLESLNNITLTIFFKKLGELLINAAKIQKPIALILSWNSF